MVTQVRATELVRSAGYGTQYTLRFPRVMRLRSDKPVADAMTLQEFNKLVDVRLRIQTHFIPLSSIQILLILRVRIMVLFRNHMEWKIYYLTIYFTFFSILTDLNNWASVIRF